MLEYALKSQNKSFADFVEKYIFEEYLTWIVFSFKLDIFRNNMRFGFIL
jgi:dissimilatory sulfite reductase (desulfoviridin) alpha/beta subunit